MISMLMSQTCTDSNRWSCKVCTFFNPVSIYPKCEVCEEIDPQVNENKPISDTNGNQLRRTTSTSVVLDHYHKDELDASEKLFNDILSYCRTTKIHFVDDQFLPSFRSIGDLTDHSLQWLRISQICSFSLRKDQQLTWTVYSSPSPSDIQQGILGDCWLLAALTLIAEQPKILERIVLTKQVNEEGIYLIRICHNGLWKTVIVDDCFPCTKYNQLAYSQANRCQLYVPLIEKACAKLFGSYAELCGGHAEEGLQLLTGAPCDRIIINSQDEEFNSDLIWAKLLSACEFQLLIGAATGRTDVSENEYNHAHINTNHVFSILAAHTLPTNSMRFVLVRDPHATTDYREPLITPIILVQLNSFLRSHLSSGAFWISWPVFLQFFASITISSYISDYYDVRQVAQFTQSSKEPIPAFHFYVPQRSPTTISLIYHRQSRHIPCYHTQFFVLCDVKGGQVKTIGTHVSIIKAGRHSLTHWSGLLNPGYYILIPFSTTFWNEKYVDLQRDYTLVIHSKFQLDIQLINEPATILTDCIIVIILKQNHKLQQNQYFNYYTTHRQSDFSIFIAENTSRTHYLYIDMNLAAGISIQNSRQSFITRDCIPPNHRHIVFFTEWTHQGDETAFLDYDFEYLHVKQSLLETDIFYNDFHSYRPI